MPLNFPDAPTNGQSHTGPSAVTWVYDGTKWVANAPPGGTGMLPLGGGTVTGDLSTSPGNIGNIDSLWSDHGAIVTRFSDRLFVGAAAAVTAGNSTNSPTNWLASLPNLNYTGVHSQQIVLSTAGTLALTAGARASDSRTAFGGNTGAAIGISGYAINDDTLPGTRLAFGPASVGPRSVEPRSGFPNPAVWAGYFEARRNIGVAGTTVGIEIDIDNAGSTVDIFPHQLSMPGQTIGLDIASGGATTTHPVSAALLISANGSQFRKGILFHDQALDFTVGSTGFGVAIELGEGMEIRWMDATSAIVRSSLYASSGGLGIGSSMTVIGDVVCANVNTGYGLSTAAATIELGGARTGNGAAVLDFHATPGTDQEFRIARLAGANGNAFLQQSGTGGISVTNQGNPVLTVPAGSQVWLNSAAPTDLYGFILQHHTAASATAIAATSTLASTQVYHWIFRNGAGQSGAISTTGSTTLYATTSDESLKRDLGPATDLTALRRTKIHDFEWLFDNARGRGVFAREQLDVLPGMIAVPPENQPETPYMADYSKLVPDLVVGWQAHEQEITELKAMVATLSEKPA